MAHNDYPREDHRLLKAWTRNRFCNSRGLAKLPFANLSLSMPAAREGFGDRIHECQNGIPIERISLWADRRKTGRT
jgi:hypothetical protein